MGGRPLYELALRRPALNLVFQAYAEIWRVERSWEASPSPFRGKRNVERKRQHAQLSTDRKCCIARVGKRCCATQQISVVAMQQHGIPVTYVYYYPDEGHGFGRPVNRRSFAAVVKSFLATYLCGRCELGWRRLPEPHDRD